MWALTRRGTEISHVNYAWRPSAQQGPCVDLTAFVCVIVELAYKLCPLLTACPGPQKVGDVEPEGRLCQVQRKNKNCLAISTEQK